MTIELIKATGSCQMTPNDSFALRDVSESGRSVGEKVMFFSILFRLGILLFQQNIIIFCRWDCLNVEIDHFRDFMQS